MAAQVSVTTGLTLGERLIGVWLAMHADRDTRRTVAPISRLMELTGQCAGYVSEALKTLSGECGLFLWLNADTWRNGQKRYYLCRWDGKPRWKKRSGKSRTLPESEKRSGNFRTLPKTKSVHGTAQSVREFPEGNSSIEDNNGGGAGSRAPLADGERASERPSERPSEKPITPEQWAELRTIIKANSADREGGQR
jgi:hypothetical protein